MPINYCVLNVIQSSAIVVEKYYKCVNLGLIFMLKLLELSFLQNVDGLSLRVELLHIERSQFEPVSLSVFRLSYLFGV